MQGAINILWFVAGHLSAGVVAMWLNRKWGLGGIEEHPFYKDGYQDGYRDGHREANTAARNRTVQIEGAIMDQLNACQERLAACEAAQREDTHAG